MADAFDAMTANRVYRKQMDFDYVLSEIRNGRGTQFDPHIADVFLKLIDDGKIDIAKLYNVPPEEMGAGKTSPEKSGAGETAAGKDGGSDSGPKETGAEKDSAEETA